MGNLHGRVCFWQHDESAVRRNDREEEDENQTRGEGERSGWTKMTTQEGEVELNHPVQIVEIR
jgi:hypothetical protein